MDIDFLRKSAGGELPQRRDLLRPKLFLLAGDVLALLAAFLLGGIGRWLVTGRVANWGLWAEQGPARLLLFLGLTASVVAVFWGVGLYSRRRPFWDELLLIFKALLAVAILDAATVFLGKWPFSRLSLLLTWLFALVLVPLLRMQIKRALIRSGRWLRPTVILGAGENAREAVAALQSERLMGFDMIALLALPGDVLEGNWVALADRRMPVMQLGDDPHAVLRQLGYPHLVAALEPDAQHAQQKLLQQLSLTYGDMDVIPPIRGLPLLGMEVTHFFSHEVLMLTVRNNLDRLGPRLVKRAFDFIGATALLLALSPIFAFIALKIWREDGGPVIFRQQRVGFGGRLFTFYKFRSMVRNADEVLERWKSQNPEMYKEYEKNNFKLKNDPRVLKVGAWIRHSSLDELPQLWNVLKGDMSLVGPRPMLERELPYYGDSLPFYLGARPGITGLWQISGRSETTFCDRAGLDAWYVRNWSLGYDIAILFKTVKVVLAQKGAY